MSKLNEFRADELLIALLEGELDPEMQKDLELILKSSKADRKKFYDYQAVREIIELCETHPPARSAAQEEKYFAGLHSRIMEQIPEPDAPSGRSRKLKRRSLFVGGFMGGVTVSALTLAIYLALYLGANTRTEADKSTDSSAHLVSSTALDRDFKVEVAEQKFNSLNDAQVQELLKRLTL
jgi:hypothetical protein